MSERKVIATGDLNVNINPVKITIVDEEFFDKLPELAKFEHLIFGVQGVGTAEEKLLREIFGEDACEIHKVKVISVSGNEIEIENYNKKRGEVKINIKSIEPWYPEYDKFMIIDENDNIVPEWEKIFELQKAKEG